MKLIQSRENPLYKQLLRLAQKARERKVSGLCVLDGIHLVESYALAGFQPQQLFIAAESENHADVQQLLQRWPEVDVVALGEGLIAQVSGLESPASVIALIEQPKNAAIPSDAESLLVLENVQDPGNVGSMLRSAAAAGIPYVLCTPGTAALWSPKVLRAAQGAHFSLQLTEEVDVLNFASVYTGKFLALSPHATTSLYDCDLREPVAWLMGNEGAGLSEALMQCATQQVMIPMAGNIESLNVAATAAICLFEMVRQRAA